MSEQAREERTISIDQLLAEATLLKEYINFYENQALRISSILAEVRKAKDSIDALTRSKDSEEIIVKLDTLGLSLARVKDVERDNVLLNLGLDIYVYVDTSFALNYLSKVESALVKDLESTRKVLDELTKRYAGIQQFLASLQRAASEQASR